MEEIMQWMSNVLPKSVDEQSAENRQHQFTVAGKSIHVWSNYGHNSRWLIAKGKMEEAKKVLSAASKKNGRPVEPDQIVLTKPSTAAAGGSFLDIMKHPVLRYQTLIMFHYFIKGRVIVSGHGNIYLPAYFED